MFLRRELVEVADREVGVQLALEPAQLLDGGSRDPLATAPRATVLQDVHAVPLDRPPDPPHVSWSDAQDISGLQPADPLLQRLHEYLLLGHRLRLPGDPALDWAHSPSSPLAPTKADITNCSCPGHLQCSVQSVRTHLDVGAGARHTCSPTRGHSSAG